ncbi:MAG: phenylalanine--tRNA ligase subunit alpha [Firmicutes bacterium HGW-Firmicutes-14]|nr:MAG: phenylalanine--tRNA ligase subunit alpha [Firmicutes bacterium HGW-Firmicutes-14]
MREKLEALKREALDRISAAGDLNLVNEIRVMYLGKKGELTGILRGMGSLSPEERPVIGQLANEVRESIENGLNSKTAALKEAEKYEKLDRETIDVTLPGRTFNVGRRHPLTQVMNEIKEIFLGLGFEIADGPEVELDYYNFEALNFPADHPARDMQDSFYIGDGVLLRTHTSSVQPRVMEKKAPAIPVKAIGLGKVYRRDDDATHSPMFHQVEGFMIDKKISFSDLKGVLLIVFRQMFGEDRQIRLRPSFFPFTEPSAEVDVSCIICNGEGCRTCSNTGWLEILGAGMIHPNVLKMSGYDPEQVTGFAFGMGIERVVMLKYGIDDLRLYFDNDKRFLAQF